MKYIYKMIPVPRNIAVKSGKDLGESIAEYVEETVNKMAEEGWEFYRSDEYTVSELLGCLPSLFGQTGKVESYNVLSFRKEI